MTEHIYTAEQCLDVVKETGMTFLGHHRCGVCGVMVGHRFAKAGEIFTHPDKENLKPDDIVVGFDSRCDCSSHYISAPRHISWDEFAHTFNMQSTAEGRLRMWERFKAGLATHE